MLPKDREIRALIKLLEDDDIKIAAAAAQALKDRKSRAFPALRYAADADSIRLRVRSRELLEELRLRDLEDRFASWAAQLSEFSPEAMDEEHPVYAALAEENRKLEVGAVMLSSLSDPHCDPDWIRTELSRIAERIRIPLRTCRTVEERIRTINHFLFDDLGYSGNTREYHHPDNSYLHRVLQKRVGIPISLSLVYLCVARRLGQPIRGIGMPGHFIVEYVNRKQRIFLDPFHRGRVLTKQECARLLMRSGYGYRPEFLAPVPAKLILVRMLNNLIGAYERRNDPDRADVIKRLRSYFIKEYEDSAD